MKKNLIIGVLVVISILSITFGYNQKERADLNEEKALENAILAGEAELRAQEQMKISEAHERRAEANLKDAIRQREIAEKNYKKSKSK